MYYRNQSPNKVSILVKWKLDKLFTILLPKSIKLLHLRESHGVSSKARFEKSEVIGKEIPLCFRNRNIVWVSETEWNGTTRSWSISTVKLNSSTGCNEWGSLWLNGLRKDRLIHQVGLSCFESGLGRISSF